MEHRVLGGEEVLIGTDYVRIYQSLGVSLNPPKPGSVQITGICPFCGRPKFSIHARTGQGHCWACPVLMEVQGKEGFNLTSFIRLLWETAYPDGRGLNVVSEEKNIPISELVRWGFRYSRTGKIILPGYDIAGRIVQLYQWQPIKGKNRMIGTESLPAALVYLPQELKASTVYVCEGIWDAIVLRSHLNQGTTIAVPGATIFKDEWVQMFRDRNVYLCYDNDQAGQAGMQRALDKLYPVARNVYVIDWPDGLPDGYDIRDYLTDHSYDYKKLKRLFVRGDPGVIRHDIPFQTLIDYWHRAMAWSDTLTDVLAVLLAVCVNTFVKGDQIWLRLIGAPSSGKTTLCEALGLLKEYVTVVSTMTGFYSGWLGEDSSLIRKVNNRILITKDGDTLLQSPKLRQILSEARDIYDGFGRAIYRNTVDREYESIRLTWILAGTSLITNLGDRELGERFLNVTTYRLLPERLEAPLAYKRIEQTVQQINIDNSDRPHALQQAMLATAGYLKTLIESTQRPPFNLGPEEQVRLYHLAAFTARLRSRPSKQEEFVEREIAARLCSQLTKLLYCLMIVFRVDRPTEDCWRCLKKVAIDTSDGVSFQIVQHLHCHGEQTLSDILQHVPICRRTFLDYLTSIGVLERNRKPIRWRLNDDFRELYESVMNDY